MLEASARLAFHVFARRSFLQIATQRPKLRPHPGTCLMLGNSVRFDVHAHSGIASLSALILHSALALRVHPHRLSEAAAIAARRTPQPTSSERPRAQKTRAAHFRFCGLWLPLTHLDRRATMTAADTLPGESNAQIMSSIINLVCPQCGGRMSEFQCEGRCRRNWLAEWEWANQATSSAKSRRGHAGRPMR